MGNLVVDIGLFRIFQFFVLVLAADAVTTVWFYGSIFEKPLNYFKNRKDMLGELMSCNLCLPYHIAFWFVLLTTLSLLMPTWVGKVWEVVLYSLAVTDLLHFLQQVRPFVEDKDERTKST